MLHFANPFLITPLILFILSFAGLVRFLMFVDSFAFAACGLVYSTICHR